jgi:hypothetical protein
MALGETDHAQKLARAALAVLWLENAECLRLSAKLSWDAMKPIALRSPVEGDIRMRGHALKKHIAALTDLSIDESYLVERLEVYLLWAGRYPVPKRAEAYEDAVCNKSRNFRGADLENTDRLFSRLVGILKSEIANSI